jgi:hypothetical protein
MKRGIFDGNAKVKLNVRWRLSPIPGEILQLLRGDESTVEMKRKRRTPNVFGSYQEHKVNKVKPTEQD